MSKPLVSIVMGSRSDLEVMDAAAVVLGGWGIPHEIDIVSAHRTPHRLVEYATQAAGRGVKVIIAGAGGAAHLPGMIASMTTLPVIGVPIQSLQSLSGWDSILSILQMPSGVPVATVALNGASNAGILAAQILAVSDTSIRQKVEEHKAALARRVIQSAAELHHKEQP